MTYQEYRPSSSNILPVVVKNLLIINTLLWLAEYVFSAQLGFSINERFGLYYPLSSSFNPIQFVTHLFLHGSFMHLLSNMFALWMFGSVIENFWGPKRFLIFYFTCGLGAALIQTLSTGYEVHQLQEVVNAYAATPNPTDFVALIKGYVMYLPNDAIGHINDFVNSWEMSPNDHALATRSIDYAQDLVTYKMNVPTIGASGAIFGLLLAFGMLFPNTLIYLYFAIPIKAKYFVIMYGLFELYSGFSNNPGDNVAHFAHLGGMLFGFILIKIWNKRDRQHFY